MSRVLRADVGGITYHVLNRANARARIFNTAKDYMAFESLIADAQKRVPIDIFSYCIMPNHWHFIFRTKKDGDLALFVGWLTQTHTQRRHAMLGTTGTGHLYQGRFKSFPIQKDGYFLQVQRYVERNPVQAKLVRRIEQWRWSSGWQRSHGRTKYQPMLAESLFGKQTNHINWLNEPQSSMELDAIRSCISRNRPFGEAYWVHECAKHLGITQTLRSRGRPKM